MATGHGCIVNALASEYIIIWNENYPGCLLAHLCRGRKYILAKNPSRSLNIHITQVHLCFQTVFDNTTHFNSVRPFRWTGVFIFPKRLRHLLFDSILQMSFIIMHHPCHEDQSGCWTFSTSYWPSIQPLVSQWSRLWLILTLRLVEYCCCSWLLLARRLGRCKTHYHL